MEDLCAGNGGRRSVQVGSDDVHSVDVSWIVFEVRSRRDTQLLCVEGAKGTRLLQARNIILIVTSTPHQSTKPERTSLSDVQPAKYAFDRRRRAARSSERTKIYKNMRDRPGIQERRANASV